MFSKDDEGCISAEELKFVMTHLPGKVEKMMVMVLCAFAGELKLGMTKNYIQVTYKEIDEMIHTVDKNGDGKISYSEFRVMMGAPPLLHTLPSGHQ